MKWISSLLMSLFLLTSFVETNVLAFSHSEEVPVYQIYKFGADIDSTNIPQEVKVNLQNSINNLGDINQEGVVFATINNYYDEDGNLCFEGFIRNGTNKDIYNLTSDITIRQEKKIIAKDEFNFSNIGVIKSGESVYKIIMFGKNVCYGNLESGNYNIQTKYSYNY